MVDLRRTVKISRLAAALIFASANALLLARCGTGTSNPSTTAAPSPATPIVSSITVTGTAPLIGQSAQFVATAQLSDGSLQNVTTTAIWLSSATTVATVSSAGIVTSIAA